MVSLDSQNMCRSLLKPKLGFLTLLLIVFFLLPNSVFSESKVFDPVLISLKAAKLGASEIPALIEGHTLYLSVTDLFDFLKIKYIPITDGIVEGYIMDQNDAYQINLSKNTISHKNNTFSLPPGTLLEMDGLIFLNSNFFGEVFGLYCEFDYRNLSVKLNTDLELPVYRQIRRELIRKNMGVGQIDHADTVLNPIYSLFKMGGLDWDLSMNKWVGLAKKQEGESNNSVPSRGSLNLAGELAFGDFQARITWFGSPNLDYRNVNFRWKKVLTNQKALTQITLGRINGASFSTVFQPITGVTLTNAPPVARKAFGFHTIRDFTHPFWIVELYLNNELVDFVKTDENGLYLFEFPLNYGTNKLQLKFYGPNGEEEIQEESLFVPFILLPKKELIYQINTGVVHGLKFEKIANAQLNYGLTKSITIGAGLEYFTGLGDRLLIPRLTSSNKLGKNMMLSTEWLPGLKSSGVLNARTNKGIVLDLSFEKLKEGQEAFPQLRYLRLMRFSGTIPIKTKRKVYSSRINLTEFVYPNSRIQTLQWSINGDLFGAFSNFSTYVSRYNQEIFLTSNLQQSYRLPANWRLNGRVQINFQRMNYSNLMMGFEKALSRDLRITSFYQTDFKFRKPLMGFSVKFNLGVFQGATNARIQGEEMLINQSLMGSVSHDKVSGNLNFSSISELGRSTLIILPFLDINNNDVRDKDETYQFELLVKVKGASPFKDPKTGITRVKNLIPYKDYLIELDENSLADITWRLDHKKIQLTIKPGNSNKLEIPIKVVNEVEGKVLLNNKGLGGIKVQFLDDQNRLIKEVISQEDGTFYYSNITAGKFTFQPDTTQLEKLGITWRHKKLGVQFEEGVQGEYSSDWIIELSRTEK